MSVNYKEIKTYQCYKWNSTG